MSAAHGRSEAALYSLGESSAARRVVLSAAHGRSEAALHSLGESSAARRAGQ